MAKPEPRAYLHASSNGRLCEVRLLTDRAEVLAASGYTMPENCDAALIVSTWGTPLVLCGTREQLAEVFARWSAALSSPHARPNC